MPGPRGKYARSGYGQHDLKDGPPGPGAVDPGRIVQLVGNIGEVTGDKERRKGHRIGRIGENHCPVGADETHCPEQHEGRGYDDIGGIMPAICMPYKVAIL
jgi:hypothetical protein